MEWRPVSATVPFEVEGNEIFIPAGVAEVTVELYISNWAPELIGAYQATILSSGYSSGAAGTLSPNTTPIACETSDDCLGHPSGNPCSGGFCLWHEGAFIDIYHPEWVYAGRDWPHIIYAINTVTLDYIWGVAAVAWSEAEDPGSPKYGATLVLYVSHDARGTFTLEIDPDFNRTLVNSASGIPIRPLALKPGLITIVED